jgi:hypothetical protein
MSAQQKTQKSKKIQEKQDRLQNVMNKIRSEVQKNPSLYLKNSEVPFGGE